MSDEKYPYQKEWEEFIKSDANYKKGRLLAPLLVFLFFIGKVVPENFLEHFLVTIFVIVISVILWVNYLFWKSMRWRCPKCLSHLGNQHYSFFLWKVKGDCKFCGLKKWEGSNIKDDGGFWSNG